MRWRKTNRLKQLAGRFYRKQDGTAAVEFALVGLPFFWLIMIVFETAAVLFTDIALQNGVTETARLIRTGQVQTQGIGASRFKELLCGNIASYIDCGKIRIEVTRSAALPLDEAQTPDMMTAPDEAPQAFQPGGPMEWVLVQARYDWKLIMPGLSQLSNMGTGSNMRRLTAGAMFRNEPYGG